MLRWVKLLTCFFLFLDIPKSLPFCIELFRKKLYNNVQIWICLCHLGLPHPSPLPFSLSVIRVDCITVSTLPVKASVEDHIQQLFDALLTSLRRSIQTNLSAIDQFLVKGKDALSVRPQTIEEIGDVNQAYNQLAKEKPSVS